MSEMSMDDFKSEAVRVLHELRRLARHYHDDDNDERRLALVLPKLESAKELVDHVLLKKGKVPTVLTKWLSKLTKFVACAKPEKIVAYADDATAGIFRIEAFKLRSVLYCADGPTRVQPVPRGHTPFSWEASPGEPPRSHTSYSWGSKVLNVDSDAVDRLLGLCRIVRAVRELEASETFKGRLLADVVATSKSSAYTRDNFAYGTTPFQSWLAVFQCEAVQVAVSWLRASLGSHAAVLGSSHGLLCFFNALFFGVRTIGYEIMPYLGSECFSELAHIGAVSPNLCTSVVGDMLRADLTACALVLLTSQCWDPELCTCVYDKLCTELATGSIVVDYLPRLADRPSVFECVHIVHAAVSWGVVAFHVFRHK